MLNIALSALDDHFDQQWRQQMPTEYRRAKRRRNGMANYKIVRYAGDFVIMVSGDRHHAEELREEVAAVLAPLGLRLSPEKTAVVHIDEGFDFLGFHIRRQRKRGTQKWYVYTRPSRKAIQSIKDKVSEKTYRSTRHQDLDELLRSLNMSLAGWANHFRARRVQGHLQRGRPPCVEPADALDQGQVRGQVRAEHETDAAALLRRRMEVRLQRGRVHRRLQRQGDPLPLPRWQHPDPVDPGTAGRAKQLTTGQDTRSARCGESRTPGARGDRGKRTVATPKPRPRSNPTCVMRSWCSAVR